MDRWTDYAGILMAAGSLAALILPGVVVLRFDRKGWLK